jgi:deoxycytidylate deaminase
MGEHDSHLRIARQHARRSNHPQFRLAALVLRGGNIVSIGWNKDHLHAEHTALNRAWRSDLEGSSLLVVRLKKSGTFGMARPCPDCMQRIHTAGIKKVMYTNEVGELETIRPTLES